MTDSKLAYCQTMVYLCETQSKEWESIADGLTRLLRPGDVPVVASPASVAAQPIVAQNAPPEPAPAQPPQVEDPARAEMRLRMAHVIRGMILIFALGLPRVFYYVYGGYGVLVLSGVMNRLQSVQFRRYLTGSRPTLDLQLSRLRQRREALLHVQQMEQRQSIGEDVDEAELTKHREFLQQFTHQQSWLWRFVYQLPVMFLYSALPSCHPHSEYLT